MEGPGDTGASADGHTPESETQASRINQRGEEMTRIATAGHSLANTLARALNPGSDSSDISAPDVAADTRFCTKHQ